MYRIIGFNDEVTKYAGPCQRFREADCFDIATLPTEAQLREYATLKGYLPRKGRGISQDKCEPVYLSKRVDDRPLHNRRASEIIYNLGEPRRG